MWLIVFQYILGEFGWSIYLYYSGLLHWLWGSEVTLKNRCLIKRDPCDHHHKLSIYRGPYQHATTHHIYAKCETLLRFNLQNYPITRSNGWAMGFNLWETWPRDIENALHYTVTYPFLFTMVFAYANAMICGGRGASIIISGYSYNHAADVTYVTYWDRVAIGVAYPRSRNSVLGVWRLSQHTHINSNLVKSRLPRTYFSVAQSFWNFAQSTAVILPCSVWNIETIEQMKNMLRTNEISRDLSLSVGPGVEFGDRCG